MRNQRQTRGIELTALNRGSEGPALTSTRPKTTKTDAEVRPYARSPSPATTPAPMDAVVSAANASTYLSQDRSLSLRAAQIQRSLARSIAGTTILTTERTITMRNGRAVYGWIAEEYIGEWIDES